MNLKKFFFKEHTSLSSVLHCSSMNQISFENCFRFKLKLSLVIFMNYMRHALDTRRTSYDIFRKLFVRSYDKPSCLDNLIVLAWLFWTHPQDCEIQKKNEIVTKQKWQMSIMLLPFIYFSHRTFPHFIFSNFLILRFLYHFCILKTKPFLYIWYISIRRHFLFVCYISCAFPIHRYANSTFLKLYT